MQKNWPPGFGSKIDRYGPADLRDRILWYPYAIPDILTVVQLLLVAEIGDFEAWVAVWAGWPMISPPRGDRALLPGRRMDLRPTRPTQRLKLQNHLSPRLIGAGWSSKYQALCKDIIRFDPAGQRGRNDWFWSRKPSATKNAYLYKDFQLSKKT